MAVINRQTKQYICFRNDENGLIGMRPKFRIGPSKVHGSGIIAIGEIKQGEVIGVAIVMNKIIPHITEDLGRYVNHSNKANSRLQLSNGKYYLVATKDIKVNEEVFGNYNDTPFFLEKPRADFI